jgi:putative phage-type endonuclease
MGLEVIKLEHNSPEWLSFRRTGIGGSDAAAVLGLSPFKTNVEVWEEKVGLKEPEDISAKPQVKYGTEAETPLFQLFALDHPQYRCKQDKKTVYKRGFMFASLDGELERISTGERGIYEGKTTEIHGRSTLIKWDGRVPDYYYVQVLHQLVVTGWRFEVLKAQLKLIEPDGNIELLTRHYPYERADLLEDLKYLYLEEKTFWGYVERKERPPLKLPSLDRNL